MAAILSRPQCVKESCTQLTLCCVLLQSGSICGREILCRISKAPFQIPCKISCPDIDRHISLCRDATSWVLRFVQLPRVLRFKNFWKQSHGCTFKLHYSDVIMGAMASQITSLAIVYSTVYPGADQRKHQSSTSLALCEGNSPVTGEFPAQRASSAENGSIWWRHHGLHNLGEDCKCYIIAGRQSATVPHTIGHILAICTLIYIYIPSSLWYKMHLSRQ